MADKFKLNPFTGKLDNVGLDQTAADSLYVKKAGDTMAGIFKFSTYPFYMTASDGTTWAVTVVNNGGVGALDITQITVQTGNPIAPPPFLWMTYA